MLKNAAAMSDQAERTALPAGRDDLTTSPASHRQQRPLAFTANVDGYVPNPTGTEFFNTVVVN
jgi:hypothetical protein